MTANTDIPTPAELRAARGLLGWSQAHLAQAAGVSWDTIVRYEGGRHRPRRLEAIKAAIEHAGVRFVGTRGVVFSDVGDRGA